MRFSREALARIGEALDPVFAGAPPDHERLVAISMGLSVPMDDGSFRTPSLEAQALAREILWAEKPGRPTPA